jgi:LacI family transcriptional regulator
MKSHASGRAEQFGSLRHIRRNVLLLLGTLASQLRVGIVRYAREAGWILDDTYSSQGMVPTWWQGDGILALITKPEDARAQSLFPGLPLVDFSKGWISSTMPARYRTAGLHHPRVLGDSILIARLAADHFTERGFKHIAYLNAGNYWMEQERLPVFREAVQAAGATFYEIDYYRQLPGLPKATEHRRLVDSAAMHQWLVKTLAKLPKPLAVAVASDHIALRVVRACNDARLKVPEEVAILGCHNDPFICDFAPVPLSSVDDNLEQCGYEGAKLLDQIMGGRRPPKKPVIIPPRGVVTRVSTNVLAVEDPRIARAIRFIFEHYPEPQLSPDVLAGVAGLSRSGLDRAFHKYLGHSPAQEITNVRIGHAKRLLLNSGHKAHEVATQTGFSSIVHFSQAFHRITGIRPSKFRERNEAKRG